jgi:hypothetical protein
MTPVMLQGEHSTISFKLCFLRNLAKCEGGGEVLPHVRHMDFLVRKDCDCGYYWVSWSLENPSAMREYGIYLCQKGKAAILTPAPPGTEFGWSFRGFPYCRA